MNPKINFIVVCKHNLMPLFTHLLGNFKKKLQFSNLSSIFQTMNSVRSNNIKNITITLKNQI